MKQYYVYLTTNLINGKKYIGQHYGEVDDNYIGSGSTLKKAINKYGKGNFKKEILCICATPEELDKKEIELIEEYQAIESDYFIIQQQEVMQDFYVKDYLRKQKLKDEKNYLQLVQEKEIIFMVNIIAESNILCMESIILKKVKRK